MNCHVVMALPHFSHVFFLQFESECILKLSNRVFLIQEEQVLQFLKDVFSEAVTKKNYHNHLAQEGTKSIRYYIS